MPPPVPGQVASYAAEMAAIEVDVEASDVGMSQSRLDRLDRHFRDYVDDGRLTGWLVAIARAGKTAHLSSYGMRDREASIPVETDTVWRLASMTKPITSVAALMLYEEGAFELKDPIAKWIPSFGEMSVYRSGSSANPDLRPATEPMRVWHLLTHTSGLTYGFHYAHPVDAMYRSAGFEWGNPPGVDLAGCCELWAAQPLLFEPGSEWNYGVSTDVLGRLIEVVSGQTLAAFFGERIFEPLGMVDTGFDPTATRRPAGGGLRGQPGRVSRSAGAPAVPSSGVPARDALRRRRPGRHSWRLSPVLRDAASWRCTGGNASLVASNGLVHDPEPPSRRRRPRGVRPTALFGDHLRRHRLRSGGVGRDGPPGRQGAHQPRSNTGGEVPSARHGGWRPRRT